MKNQFYKKYISTHYKNVVNDINISYRKRFYVWKSYLEKFLPENKNINILEVGSAVGHNLYSLNKLGYKNILGIDFSAECVEFCEKMNFHSLLVNDEKKFYESNRNKFDLIILYDVLEHHLPMDGKNLLLNIKKALRNDGKLIISVPNADYPFNLGLLYKDITHRFIYNEASLLQLLKNCGFTNNKFIQINSYTIYDENYFKRFFKKSFLSIISFFGELFWKFIGLSQGIILKECKPTLICISRKK